METIKITSSFSARRGGGKITARRFDAMAPENAEQWTKWARVEVEIDFVINETGEEWLVVISGGPTGFESVQVSDLRKQISEAVWPYWLACIGTAYIPGGRAWDRLEIPCEELVDLVDLIMLKEE